MCGIFGAFGNINLQDSLKALRSLEYRGYDSAGIAYKANKIKVVKVLGSAKNLEDKIKDKETNYVISHTRWATNGVVSIPNAHPHQSLNKRVTLVHNGILENEDEIKNKYLPNMFFKSETDSEVIVALADLLLKTLEPAKMVEKLKTIIKGNYAILILVDGINGIFYLKNKSSLILAYDDCNNYYLTSDIISLPANTVGYKMIPDGKSGLIDKGTNDRLDFRPFVIKEKQNFHDNRMIKEIKEEIELVDPLVKECKNINENITNLIKKSKEIVILGAGSSYYAGLYGAKLFSDRLKIRTDAYLASEFVYKDYLWDEETLFIFISQSGETADLIKVNEQIKQGNKVLITNRINSTLDSLINNTLDIKANEELAVGATKSFNQTVLLFYLLTEKILGSKNSEIEIYKKNLEFFYKKDYKDILSNAKKVFFIGKEYDYIASLEGALKLKEITYLPTWGMSSSELKHGSLALVDSETIVIGLCSVMNNYLENSLNEVKARKGKTMLVKTPFHSPYLGSLALITYAQLLTYYTAVDAKLNPDLPRNLAKSVTVL